MVYSLKSYDEVGMDCQELLDRISPRGSGLDLEAFATYLSRIDGILPNVPVCVLEQWLHRHGTPMAIAISR